MEKAARSLNQFKYLKLANKNINPTYPISVDHTFLSEFLSMERHYHEDKVILFRKNSHPVNLNHVTEASIRLFVTISRRFNTEGEISGVPIYQLYKCMCEEYEDPGSKEQFYAEVQKFIDNGLLSISQDGVVHKFKIDSFKRDTNRFILFNPLIFTKSFTNMEIAAQKLYLHIVSRSGTKTNEDFKESIKPGCWIYTLTHKNRPSQIRKLLKALNELQPISGQSVVTYYSVSKDSLGNWMVSARLNPSYMVRHEEGNTYKMVPQAKIPYSKTTRRLRHHLAYCQLSEFEGIGNGLPFLRLIKVLDKANLRKMRYAVLRLKELFESGLYHDADEIVSLIELELSQKDFISYIDITKETTLYDYLFVDDPEWNHLRPVQFVRTISKYFDLKVFRRICRIAARQLRKGIEPRGGPPDTFYIEDYLREIAN